MNRNRDLKQNKSQIIKNTGITSPKGFRAAAGTCGIKPSGSPDLALIVADRSCSAAGVFTRNRIPGEPVKVSKKHLRTGFSRAIICNSGVSNVCTGRTGKQHAVEMCRLVAGGIGCDAKEVLVCSTGVIGVLLPIDRITAGITDLCSRLDRGASADRQVARAIMTTDLVTKTAAASIRIGGKTVTIAGVAKGSGMISPDMATMLCFITTDAAITPRCLSAALGHAVDNSMNRISVDQDTSTSDSVLVLASGLAGHRVINRAGGNGFHCFRDALTEVSRDLATQIVRDGEGATRLFRVHVSGARDERDADRVGRTVTGSPLVKTAIHGGDPNWGRIVMAVGRSGAAVKPSQLSVSIGDQAVFFQGQPVNPSPRDMKQLERIMQRKEVDIHIDLGSGGSQALWLGCDLSRQYVAINADYTT